jgi:hypothetical protein
MNYMTCKLTRTILAGAGLEMNQLLHGHSIWLLARIGHSQPGNDSYMATWNIRCRTIGFRDLLCNIQHPDGSRCKQRRRWTQGLGARELDVIEVRFAASAVSRRHAKEVISGRV